MYKNFRFSVGESNGESTSIYVKEDGCEKEYVEKFHTKNQAHRVVGRLNSVRELTEMRSIVGMVVIAHKNVITNNNFIPPYIPIGVYDLIQVEGVYYYRVKGLGVDDNVQVDHFLECVRNEGQDK